MKVSRGAKRFESQRSAEREHGVERIGKELATTHVLDRRKRGLSIRGMPQPSCRMHVTSV